MMTQKLVIKTKVAANQQPAKAISYEWHWRRIWAALLSCALILGALGYVLVIGVNADESDNTEFVSTTFALTAPSLQDEITQSAQQDAQFEATDVLASDTVAVIAQQFSSADAPDLVASIPMQQAEAQLLAQTNAQFDDTDALPSDTIAQIAQQFSSADAPQDLAIPTQAGDSESDAEPVTISKAQTVSPQPTVEKQFTAQAAVASVALGAKIDTSKVTRAVLTTGIEDREPINVLRSDIAISQFDDKLYFFTELHDLQDTTVHHLWYFEEQLLADIPLTVAGSRYRTYSLKHIEATQLGDWRVEAVTAEGQLLAQKQFRTHSAKP
ncbi:DUF2914 domain-containing protein [Pseudoalteromonas fenneropenaei]|uniref:DUF2914 domain-containing protein n=1 Tax=Pseudoalteromonas fenneropenaei TaxID=1737459 RepID=A0ABV7CP79_9GAMM